MRRANSSGAAPFLTANRHVYAEFCQSLLPTANRASFYSITNRRWQDLSGGAVLKQATDPLLPALAVMSSLKVAKFGLVPYSSNYQETE